MLSLHRRLISLRRSSPALSLGDIQILKAEDGVLAYERRSGAGRMQVALNLTHEPRRLAMDGQWSRAICTTAEGEGSSVSGELALAADEGVVLRPA